MGLTDKIGIAILCAFVLFLLGLTEPVTGFSLGLNFFNALTVGILGVPGLVLLVLLQMLFV